MAKSKADLSVGAFLAWVDGPGFEQESRWARPVSRWINRPESEWSFTGSIAERSNYNLGWGKGRANCFSRPSVLRALDAALREYGFPDGVGGVRKEMKEAKRGK